jgi:hypothetical protein
MFKFIKQGLFFNNSYYVAAKKGDIKHFVKFFDFSSNWWRQSNLFVIDVT